MPSVPAAGLSRLWYQLTEKLVLAPFEVADHGQQPGAFAHGGVGVALGARVFVPGQRGLGDERPDAGIVGRVREDENLLVEHGQLLTAADEPVVDIAERSFDEGPAHRG